MTLSNLFIRVLVLIILAEHDTWNEDADNEGDIEDEGEKLGDCSSFFSLKPAGRNFGLTVEDKGSSDTCDDLTDDDPSKR